MVRDRGGHQQLRSLEWLTRNQPVGDYKDSDRRMDFGVRPGDDLTRSAEIRELYAPDWKMWFPDEGDARHGTPDDPRLVLIGVDIHGAVFLEVNKPQPVVLYELMKGWLTGTEPELGKMHTLKP